MRFADDIGLIAGSKQELAELTARLDKAATLYGTEISQEKSKILVMNIKSVSLDISIPQGKLEAVHRFKHLGAAIT